MGKKFFASIIVEYAIAFFVAAIKGKAEEKAYENREQRTNPKKKNWKKKRTRLKRRIRM